VAHPTIDYPTLNSAVGVGAQGRMLEGEHDVLPRDTGLHELQGDAALGAVAQGRIFRCGEEGS